MCEDASGRFDCASIIKDLLLSWTFFSFDSGILARFFSAIPANSNYTGPVDEIFAKNSHKNGEG